MSDKSCAPRATGQAGLDGSHADFLIIGGGIAGASAGYFLAPHGRVVVLERESQPGYHATGRSAALFMASYGNRQVRALTRASLDFLERPPEGFCDAPLLKPRGALVTAEAQQLPQLHALATELAQAGSRARMITSAQVADIVPAMRPGRMVAALQEPDAYDMDVHGLHQGFLRGIRRCAGQIVCDAEVTSLDHRGSIWSVSSSRGTWFAPVVLNAAGAWADVVAALAGLPPIGLVPKRRSAFMFSPPEGEPFEHWPAVISASEDWYFKPDAGALLGSPANADPTEPQDVQPEELDIALGMHRINEVTTLNIDRPRRPWAGLRSFVADGGLVAGFDSRAAGFFWVAAQGGYGVQTSAAMGQACAALARGLPLPAHLTDQGLTAADLSPDRLDKPTRQAVA
jgi:D-arginine dehydrogenase